MNSRLDSAVNAHRKINNDFKTEVLKGLGGHPKRLSSKYFYDKNGDKLFQKIMEMPEYYLTQCELDIFKTKTKEIAESLLNDNLPFDLIELGAGDAMKSSFLLEYLVENKIDFNYMPIDISGNILSVLVEKLEEKVPDLSVIPLEGEYFDMLNKATHISNRRKVILFLGGNIGNMDRVESSHFCHELRRKLNPGDLVLIGFDLMKNPHTILNAYNDSTGITSQFNLNLLIRINRELEADFDVMQFQHYQNYDPTSGACRSFLVSLTDQKVHIGNQQFLFMENEIINMEISQKFSLLDIEKLARETGYHIHKQISDSKNWFVDSIWQV